MKTYKSIHDINDREEVTLIPYEGHPGFFKHPELNIAASRDGRFFNTKTNNELIITYDKDNRQRVQFSLNNTKIYKTKNLRVHRALARIFIGRPKIHLDKSFNVLEVNHIDGNSNNNDLSNLEWCTGKENTNHYFDNSQSSSSKPLFSKNLKTNEILKHRSTAQASKDLNITEGGLQRYIRENRYLKYRYDNYLFSFTEHGFIDVNQISLNPPDTDQECIVINKETNDHFIFNSIKESAEFIGKCYKLVWYHLKRKDEYNTDQFFIMRYNLYLNNQ